jgi:subtilisin family serine protease
MRAGGKAMRSPKDILNSFVQEDYRGTVSAPHKRRISRPMRCSLTVPFAFLCLILSSCYPWLIRPIEGPQIRLRLIAGTSKTIVLSDIDNARYLRDVRLEIFGAGSWHGDPDQGQQSFIAKAYPRGSESVTVRVEARSDTLPGNYQGQLKLQLGPDKPGLVSLVHIEVVPIDGDVGGTKIIPTRPAFPSSDRIVMDDRGQKLVRDELIVLFALKTPPDNIPAEGEICGSSPSCFICPSIKLSPVKRLAAATHAKLSPAVVRKQSKGGVACAIADITGGLFLGSVPKAKAYQLRFPDVDNLKELAAKRKEILRLSATFPELIAVSRSFVGGPLPAVNPDPPNDYGDNAASFNTINVRDAWNNATDTTLDPSLDSIPGNPPASANPPRIPVAVIDADFDDREAGMHPDLVGTGFNNVGYRSDTAYASGDLFHGTNTAGLIGARGNNGIGIAGIIWDVDLRLYDYRRGEEPIAINMLEAMVRAIDNKTLCDYGCESSEHPEADDVDIPTHPDYPAGLPLLHPHVINISAAFHQIPACVQGEVDETNAIFGQGILYGVRQNKEILWVFAAGNNGKNAKCEAPAGLTGTFPLNTMTIAATNPTAGALLEDSNTGSFVTVAAPGENLRTLRYPYDINYVDTELKSGTSIAAPIVSGLAALIFSQRPDYTARKVKQCIFQNADIAISGSSNPFNVINAGAAMPATAAADCPSPSPPLNLSNVNKLDVVLSFDTTGSMRAEIDAVKAKSQEIVNEIINAIGPGTSCPGGSPADPDPTDDVVVARSCCPEAKVCFSIVSYEDYPSTYDSSGCGTSTYNNTYGSVAAGDQPFRVHLTLTDDETAVQSAIGTLTTRSGADGPESYARVFWEVAESVKHASTVADKLKFLTNRDSLKIIINFGDNVPHDTNLNGSDLPCRSFDDGCVVQECMEGTPGYLDCIRLAALRLPNPPEINPNDTGVDPGPNDTIDDCGDDDIDLQDDALFSLIKQKVRLIHIDSSEREDLIPYWSVWTQATGGAFARIRTDGTSLVEAGTIDLPQLIKELLASIPVE